VCDAQSYVEFDFTSFVFILIWRFSVVGQCIQSSVEPYSLQNECL
jgi:hypothetical protein